MTEHIISLEKENLAFKDQLSSTSLTPEQMNNLKMLKNGRNLRQVENQYKILIKNMEAEHKSFLEDIDKLMVE